MSDNDPTIEVEINGREAYLILKYGYPFDAEEQQLQNYSRVKGWHKFLVSEFYLEHIVGDLCRSIREVKSQILMEEIDSLCSTLEMALKGTLILIKE